MFFVDTNKFSILRSHVLAVEQGSPILLLKASILHSSSSASSNTLSLKFLVSLKTLITLVQVWSYALQDSGPPGRGLDTPAVEEHAGHELGSTNTFDGQK